MYFFSFFESILSLPFIILHVVSKNSFPKPLSKKEELKYITLLRHGDKVAKNKLIKHNLRLVAHISKKYHLRGSEMDDLISIGTIGLIKAVNTFNPDKGVRLSSYSARCIENEILMHFRNINKSALDISIDEPIETDKNGNILTLMDTIACDESIADKIDVKMDIQKLKKNILKLLGPDRKSVV